LFKDFTPRVPLTVPAMAGVPCLEFQQALLFEEVVA
jgi:hypothetical protein